MAKVSREAREQRAREIIRANPEWGVPRVAKAVRAEFGVGLRWSAIQHTRTGYLSAEYRQQRARELIKGHPEWGKDHVNQALRSEFGKGLRREVVQHIKRDEVFAKGGVTERRYQQLLRDGFLPSEARAFTHLPLTSPAMMAYRAQRRHELKQAEQWGLTRGKFNEQLRAEYRFSGQWRKGKIQPLQRFGEFLQKKKLPREAARRPKERMSYDQIRIYDELRAAGFLHFEAVRIASAPSMPKAWNTGPVQDALETRRRLVDMLRRKGWDDRRIAREIRNKYEDRKQKGKPLDPWEWIRREYKPRLKIKDFVMAVHRRKQKMRAVGRTRWGKRLAA